MPAQIDEIPPERLVRRTAAQIDEWLRSDEAKALDREAREMTEVEINRAAMDDPDCPPLTEEELARFCRRPLVIKPDADDDELLDAIEALTARLRVRRRAG